MVGVFPIGAFRISGISLPFLWRKKTENLYDTGNFISVGMWPACTKFFYLFFAHLKRKPEFEIKYLHLFSCTIREKFKQVLFGDTDKAPESCKHILVQF